MQLFPEVGFVSGLGDIPFLTICKYTLLMPAGNVWEDREGCDVWGGLINPCSAGRALLESLCCLHLSQFRGLPVPGGDSAASTCHTLAAFLCPVAVFAASTCHTLAAFLSQVATLLLPPVTLLRHF